LEQAQTRVTLKNKMSVCVSKLHLQCVY